MPEAVIVDAIRTPIGRAVKGSLRAVRPDDLAAIPLKALVERNPQVDFSTVGDVMMGCGYGQGESGYNVGRIALLLAGMDHHVPGCTVNRFCASSLQTTRMAFHAIKVGEGDTYVAAGVESVSRVGRSQPPELNHKLDGSEGAPYDVYIPMGMTAENVTERCNVSREAQDEWAVISQNRAVEAVQSGHFDREIVPVTVPAHSETDKEGNEVQLPETVVSQGRRPTARHDDGGAGRAEAGVQGGRLGHRGQLLPAQRRRRRAADHERREGLRARPQAARADRRLDRRRDPPGDHGPRPDPGDPETAGEHKNGDERHRRRRDQRGVRRADRALQGGPRDRRARNSTRSAARSRSGTPSG